MFQSPSRRSFLKGTLGSSLFLPPLEFLGNWPAKGPLPPRRFCALYTANGMSLPNEKNEIAEWTWYPDQIGPDFKFNKSTVPFSPFREKLTFLGGLQHPSGPKADPHLCSDMWLTGAPLHRPVPGSFNTVSLDQVVAAHTKKHCRRPSLVLSVDAGVGYTSRTGTIAYDRAGRPIPAENNPRQIFDQLFQANRFSMADQRERLKKRIKLVDAVHENSTDLSKKLGKSDREKMDQYLTSLNEVEERLIASERWIDIPLKKQDYSSLRFEMDKAEDPGAWYRTMFDLIALAFDADITRSVAFMLNREDGMGISDTFPQKLGLSQRHHQLSHATDRQGQLDFAKYDLFLSEQLAYFLGRLAGYSEGSSNVLDNTIVLYGTGASTTHNSRNLPHLIAGGANMGLRHGSSWRRDGERLSNLYLGILNSLDIPVESFSDSTGRLEDALFTYPLA